MRLEIAIATRPHDRKGVTPPRGLDLHFLDRFLQRFGIVERADIDVREAAERIAVKRGDAGLEIDRRNPVLLALLDLEGHEEALLLRIVFRQRGHYLHVGKTVLEVKAANQIAIGLDPVRIVDVAAAKEAQQIGFVRLDDVLETVRGISVVADELDRLDTGFRALGDRENEIDPVVRLLDDFGIDAYVIAAGAAIDFGGALGVGLDHRTRQRAPRLGLDFRGKLLVLDLLVALEGNAADHRVFDHRHQQVTTRLIDLHVLEQAGLDQRFQAVINTALVETPAGTGFEIRADGLDFNAPVALDLDRRNGLGEGRRRYQHEHRQGSQQATPHSYSHIHAQPALVIPSATYGADVAKKSSKRFRSF